MIPKPQVRHSFSLIIDFVVVILLVALLIELIHIARHWEAPLQSQVVIDLRLRALPGYVLFSLFRGFAAYGLSLLFSIGYGYVAAHSERAERVMIPLLDILQSIPVLGFLPGTFLIFVTLFPRSNVGLELASILMIFTGQVWNMTFSFYQSIRNIPSDLREVTSLYQFSPWQRFRSVELPASATGLAWNSMMSMAGGWFFLMVCEAFKLGPRDFRLPGLGAYMSVAIAEGNRHAIFFGVLAMVLMIVMVDTFLWKPLLAWTEMFRMDETSPGKGERSMILEWLRRSWILKKIHSNLLHPFSEWLSLRSQPARSKPKLLVEKKSWSALTWLLGLVFLGGIIGLGLRFGQILIRVPVSEWIHLLAAALLSFLRVIAVVILGTLWTVPVGIWMGRSDRRRRQFQPLVQVAASFPAPMLYPLVLLGLHHLGCGLNFGSVILMLLGTQWYILFNVIAGASSVPEDLRETARTYHFTPAQTWWRLWLPAVSPYLVTGWVTAAGGAWNASIVAEYVTLGKEQFVTTGLGSLISVAASQGRYDLLAAGVLTMALLVVLINRYLWKPLYRFVGARYVY